jgi:hypothetical protein
MLWREKEMANNKKVKENKVSNGQDMALIVQKANEMRIAAEQFNIAIEQYKTKNPDFDVEAFLSKQKDLLPALSLLQNRELEKFITDAKNQGTNMSFHEMELGILAAGRKDMQNGLAEILDSIKFDKPTCSECNTKMKDCGPSKKKRILTSVGWIKIRAVRYTCVKHKGENVYPLQNYIELINHEVTLKNGSTKMQGVKCTRNAAASVALVCSESSYEQATLILNQIAGLDVTKMTAHRITDCVGAEFVKETPTEIDSSKVVKITDKIRNNILELNVNQMCHLENKREFDDIIRKALKDGPDGILHSDYSGPTIKVMYILCDGTGVPGRRKELAGAKGKQPDGSAKTFEAKIGAVFIVEYTVDGKPLLTKNGEIYRNKKIIYMGTVRKIEDFGPLLFQHAVENGLDNVDSVVFLGDGAQWIRGIQNEYFPYALKGVDLYHAIEHVNSMVDSIQFKGQTGSNRKKAFKEQCIEHLRCGKIQNILDQVESILCKKSKVDKFQSVTKYFRTNMDRMNYGAFTANGIFVGSGVIEAGCKVIVGNRMKHAGMHWSKNGAEKMIALRCAVKNGVFLSSYLRTSDLRPSDRRYNMSPISPPSICSMSPTPVCAT